MPTGNAVLDRTQYVMISSGLESLILQSHRDTVRIAISDLQPALDNTAFHELGGTGAAGRQNMLPIPFAEGPVWALGMTDNSRLTVTRERSQVEVTERGGIGVPVFLQDQTTPPLDVVFLSPRGQFDIVSTMVVNTRQFTAVTGHGVQVDEVLEFAVPGTNIFMQCTAVAVTGDLIEVDSLINYPFEPGQVFLRSTDDMVVDGSTTPMVFTVEPGPGQAGDITGIALTIKSNNQMDFSSFGSGIELDVGMLFRYNNGDGTYRNLFNWKNNGQFIVQTEGHYFQQKAGGGLYGFLGIVKYAGQHNKGVALRLDSARNEKLEVVVQDNLIGKADVIRVFAFGSELQE